MKESQASSSPDSIQLGAASLSLFRAPQRQSVTRTRETGSEGTYSCICEYGGGAVEDWMEA